MVKMRYELATRQIKVALALSAPIGVLSGFIGALSVDVIARGGIAPVSWTAAILGGLVGLFLGPFSAAGGVAGYAVASRCGANSFWARGPFVVLFSCAAATVPFFALGLTSMVAGVAFVSTVASGLTYFVAAKR
ncbi:hypothetical protein [Subtercola vilae]|uniref:hypothetical protein n=1 Tax=Subtercola vilae TaxID=2056433 RepID=UPI0010A9C3F0|nr:hypothetical protein [Subtercola vilae]